MLPYTSRPWIVGKKEGRDSFGKGKLFVLRKLGVESQRPGAGLSLAREGLMEADRDIERSLSVVPVEFPAICSLQP